MDMKQVAYGLAISAGLAMALPAHADPVKIALDSPASLEQSGTYVWANSFGNYLKEKGVEVEEFQRGALGDEAERLDQVSQGLLEVSMSDVRAAGTLEPLIFGAYLPYFFKDSADFQKAVNNGDIIAKINEGLTPKGVRLLAFTYLGLPAGIFNTKKPIETVADMTDLRMRALDESQIALFEAWGTTGTIVSWGEVPNALQTGVADGYINPPFVPMLFGHTEFIKHFTDAAFTPSVRIAIASEDWYQGLSDEKRKTVDDAVAAADKANMAWLEKRTGILDQLREAGVSVVELSPEARAEFRDKSQAVYTTGPVTPENLAIWRAAIGE